jgi:hypothetical protein
VASRPGNGNRAENRQKLLSDEGLWFPGPVGSGWDSPLPFPRLGGLVLIIRPLCCWKGTLMRPPFRTVDLRLPRGLDLSTLGARGWGLGRHSCRAGRYGNVAERRLQLTSLVLMVALAALVAVLVRAGRRPGRERCPRPGPVWQCRCPGCDLNLRYRRRPVGQRVFCPRCLHVFVFPVTLPAGPHLCRTAAGPPDPAGLGPSLCVRPRPA